MKDILAKHAQEESEDKSLQLLTFLLDNEVYGTDISLIQEVLEYRKVTPVPRTPDFMLGVINLRGQVVPVVDLRRQFDMTVTESTVDTCIVIVEIIVDGEETPMGILADAVKEVIELSFNNVTAPPRIGSRIDTKFISGMGEYEDDFIIILDLSKVFSSEDLHDVLDSVEHTENITSIEATDESTKPEV